MLPAKKASHPAQNLPMPESSRFLGSLDVPASTPSRADIPVQPLYRRKADRPESESRLLPHEHEFDVFARSEAPRGPRSSRRKEALISDQPPQIAFPLYRRPCLTGGSHISLLLE